jgi:hypothetical protein
MRNSEITTDPATFDAGAAGGAAVGASGRAGDPEVPESGRLGPGDGDPLAAPGGILCAKRQDDRVPILFLVLRR